MKESIFNIIQFDIEGRRVLDLFGGTGQLGIEALSRGAAHCTFVDLRREAAAVIRENLAHCRMEERATVVQGDSLAFLTGCREKFDLVFLDPPYRTGLLEKALETIAKIDIVTENGIIVCESASGKRPAGAGPPPMRRAGSTATARSKSPCTTAGRETRPPRTRMWMCEDCHLSRQL